ncbi:UNKNOWN [Stylonychia lemnae]|uniref:Uncharacterized protein n=1 Tax=Stylonychia lemnae TaxID=5949 RepID=A0A078B9M9_STYLE|nr:UNKNOWN [Stylonychia lemnae]|eukprot:CDW90273.1 UNKNOWN [Stylonychia lemnae]
MQCRKETTLRTINLEENISLKSEFSCYSTGTSKKTVEHQSMTRMQTNDLQNSSNSNFKEQLELDINDGDKLDEILLMEDDTYQDIFTQQKNILNIVECDYEMEEPLENHFNLEVPGYERGLQQIGRGFPLAIKNLKQEQNLSQYHAKQRSSML